MSQNQPTQKNDDDYRLGCLYIFLPPTVYILLSIIATTFMSMSGGDTGIKVLWIEWYRIFTGTQRHLDAFWLFNVMAFLVGTVLNIIILANIEEASRRKRSRPPKQ